MLVIPVHNARIVSISFPFFFCLTCRFRRQEGDLLAILDAGAYGMALASNYNSRPRPAEVLVDGKAVKVIRRRETIADLLRSEL